MQPVKILKALIPSSIMATMTCPSQYSRLNHPNYIRWYGTNNKVPHCEAFSTPHSHPNIRLRILFSNTLSLRSSLNVRDHVSQPYSKTGSIIVLSILIFKFLERRSEDKSVWTK